MAPNTPTPPSFLLLSCSIVTLQLTIFMQLKHLFSIVIVFNCHHFATGHLHAVKMLIFYHCHFQLSSLWNWPSSGVCPVYNIPSLGIKGTFSVLWSSANFCIISHNMHYKAPVSAQQWKTNKVVWTWKDDWPPWRTSTYNRPFTQEGNYLVIQVVSCLLCSPLNSHLMVVSVSRGLGGRRVMDVGHMFSEQSSNPAIYIHYTTIFETITGHWYTFQDSLIYLSLLGM